MHHDIFNTALWSCPKVPSWHPMIAGRERLWFWLYCVFIGVLLLAADIGLMPSVIGGAGLDKVGYFILIGIFAWLFNVAFRLGEINLIGLRIFVGTVVVVTGVTLEEIAQLWIHTRHFELIDLLADYLGIAAAEIVLRRQSLLGRLKKIQYRKILNGNDYDKTTNNQNIG
jgi:hypothetical protein